jgi:hypothetical protein
MARDGDPLAALAAPVGGDKLALVGGWVDAAQVDALVAWLQKAGEGPWWSFREWTDRMRLTEGVAGIGDDVVRLVWGRWFGDAGDLEVRRDGGRFRWRWVGDAEIRPPEDVAKRDVDFFSASTRTVLRPAEDTALLWDRADGRVATADTKTTLSLLPDKSRLRLRYTAYYDRGVVAAVRYRAIEPVPGGRKGGEASG